MRFSQAIDLFRSRERTEAFIEIFDKILQGTWRAGDAVMTKRLRDLMRGYRSTTDHPINYLSDEIYAAYPDARYILMTRPDGAEGWWKSVTEATGWHMRDDGNWCGLLYRLLVLPVGFLRRTDDNIQQMYRLWRARYGGVWGPSLYDAHNEHIRQLVPRAQLLEHDVRDGWGPLAGFLEVPVPAEPYPRLNETSAMRAIYFGMMAYGACAWLLYAGAAASAVYLAAKPGLARSIALRAVEFLSSVPARVGSK